MKRIQCIILEDEKPAIDLLCMYLDQIPFVEVSGVATNVFEAETLLEKYNIDLIFSDINIPIISGLQFVRGLKNPPLVIFTTAYEKYAVESYEVESVDYLLKPYTIERLLSALHKVKKRLYSSEENNREEQTQGALFVYSEYKEIRVVYDKIRYIKGLKDYVKIYIVDREKPIITRLNMKSIQEKLPDNQFCRVHNSYIVAFKKITSTQKRHLYIGIDKIPVGNSFSEFFFQKYKNRVMF